MANLCANHFCFPIYAYLPIVKLLTPLFPPYSSSVFQVILISRVMNQLTGRPRKQHYSNLYHQHHPRSNSFMLNEKILYSQSVHKQIAQVYQHCKATCISQQVITWKNDVLLAHHLSKHKFLHQLDPANDPLNYHSIFSYKQNLMYRSLISQQKTLLQQVV